MPCRTVPIPGGGLALVCGPRPRLRRCVVCHVPEPLATIRLCDAPQANGRGTCDAVVCVEHAVHVEPDTDYCPVHGRLAQEHA